MIDNEIANELISKYKSKAEASRVTGLSLRTLQYIWSNERKATLTQTMALLGGLVYLGREWVSDIHEILKMMGRGEGETGENQ
jgi:hypothetical protein